MPTHHLNGRKRGETMAYFSLSLSLGLLELECVARASPKISLIIAMLEDKSMQVQCS